ncbi:FAD-dependent oxidoreductase [Amylibacter sp.]|nr:FAD-dependent oxidoreductase [Amylibacter sp.]
MALTPLNSDVVVIGAGTSGLSAAKSLKDIGYSVIVIEAANHIGGRCVTDNSIFDIPFDIGGSWLHSAVTNPLAEIAVQNNFKLHKKNWSHTWVHSNGANLSSKQTKEYSQYIEDMWQNINKAGKNKKDQSIEKSLPEAKWRDIARNQIAPMMGADPDVCSAHDVFHFTNTEGDWLVENGLGAFIKYLYKDIEVITNCAAKKIDYSSNGVKVETPDGVISATYAVLTVSTGVLSQNKIKFFPKLPPRKKDAINNLPNGLLNKIGFEFNIKWREAHQGQSADYLVGENDFCSIDFGFYDSNIAVGFVAGRFAEQLEMDGPGAATSFCSEALKSIFGNDITKFINKTTETAWKSNINSYGSYSYALPGEFGAREILAETLDDRLFFAGEATMSNSQATVHGAYLSGIDVAAKILAADNSN